MTTTGNPLLDRITKSPQVMVGKPVIRGTRITVGYVLQMVSGGMTIEEILAEYTHLTRQDVLACFIYAEQTMSRNQFLPLGKGAKSAS